MEALIINNSKIITGSSSDWTDSQIISEAQKCFPKDFPANCEWVLTCVKPNHYTLEMEQCVGGYNCDRCEEPIHDDVRYYDPSAQEDYCPDCCSDDEKGVFMKLAAYPIIARDFKKEFKSDSSKKFKSTEDTEKAIARLKRLFFYLGRDGNVESLVLTQDDDEKVFGLKKMVPMLSDEKKTLKLAQEIMQKNFKSPAFSAFREKVRQCDSLKNLQDIQENKKRKQNGGD